MSGEKMNQAQTAKTPQPRTRGGIMLTRYALAVRQRPGGFFGIIVIAGMVVLAVFAPVIAPFGALQRVGQPFDAPTLSHLLGLNDVGQDVFSQLIWGGRISLLIGATAAVAGAAIGGVLGLIAGYFGRPIDTVLLAITDYFLIIPILPLGIVAGAIWGPSLRNEIIIISVLSWMQTMRVIRASVKSIRERTYVSRARSMGAGPLRMLYKHVLPAVGPLLAASTVITIGNAIYFEAALSFFGLGAPSQVSWGSMIADAANRGAGSVGAWWAIVPPGLAIGVVILATTLAGRALEDALSPRLHASHLSVRHFRVVDRGPDATWSQK